jgi:hypothetical protein
MDKAKIQLLCDRITSQTKETLKAKQLDCEVNLLNAKATYIIKNKYTYINIGGSGRYLVDNKTNEIYGIKAYGVINKSQFYGTLDTIDDYFWGDFKAYKIKENLKWKL